jgi:hypothetical protein
MAHCEAGGGVHPITVIQFAKRLQTARRDWKLKNGNVKAQSIGSCVLRCDEFFVVELEFEFRQYPCRK